MGTKSYGQSEGVNAFWRSSPDAPMSTSSTVGGALAPNLRLCYLSRLKPLLPSLVATKVAPTKNLSHWKVVLPHDRKFSVNWRARLLPSRNFGKSASRQVGKSAGRQVGRKFGSPEVHPPERKNPSAHLEVRPPNIDKFRFTLMPRLCKRLKASPLTSKQPVALQTP
ncbi:MAG: hypothetical protein ACK4I8_03405 [Armatimonadota bacterium]